MTFNYVLYLSIILPIRKRARLAKIWERDVAAHPLLPVLIGMLITGRE